MSKRGQETQGGEERYGFSNGGPNDTMDRPVQANAAQMARRKIAQAKKAGASGRSSRANTPQANPFAPQQQSMPSFQVPQGGGDGGGFNFNVNAPSNPFQNANGASGTPPPPSFGQSQQPQQQNGGGGLFGNNNTSFGSTFASNTPAHPPSNGFTFGGNSNTNGNSTPSFSGFGQSTQSQGQQNGATPSTTTSSFSFGQQPNGNTFQFGQSQQQTKSTQGTSFAFGQTPQTNGDKPATNPFASFGQSTQQQTSDKPATPALNFGQSAQQPAEKPATPSFGNFGQTNAAQPQANGDKGSMFGAATPAEQTPKPSTGSLFTFNSTNKGIGNKPAPDTTAKSSETPKAPMSNLFGVQQSTGTGLFGATPPPQETSATPKPGDSIFSAQSKPKLGGNLFTSDMAEGKRPESPAPTFGQQAQQNGQAAPNTDQTPKPNNIFGGFGQSQAQPAQDTPKPSSNLFSASSFGQTPAQPANASKSLFGQSMQDTSMHTPGSTPQKSSLFAPATSQQPTASETSAPGRSLFDRITRDDETPSTTQRETEKQTPEHPAAAPSFKPSTSLFNTPAAQPTPSSDLFSRPKEQPAAPPAPKAPSLAAQPARSQPAVTSRGTSAPSTQKASGTLGEVIPENEKDTFKVLNEGLTAHLATQDPSVDWTTVMEYYLQQAAIIRHKPAPDLTTLSAPAASASRTPAQSAERPAAPPQSKASEETAPLKKPTPFVRPQPADDSESRSSNIFGSSTAATPKAASLFQNNSSADTQQTPKPSLFQRKSSSDAQQTPKPSLFQRNSSSDAQQTPKPSFLQPPSTAPVNRKRSAEDEPERPPATEKRARANEAVEYPKLPENASDVSKAFYNALENRKPSPSLSPQKSFGSQGEKTAEKEQAHEAPSGFMSSSGQSKPSTGGFKLSGSGFTPSTAGFKPSTSGFTASAPSEGSNNFLAAFGKKASEQAEADRKKRKAEDYDSDEETEEQWAERDRKEQETKRAKLLEGAKASSGFMFKPTSTSVDKQPEKDASKAAGNDEESSKYAEKPAESGQGKSLFDRISKPAPTMNDKLSLFSPQAGGSHAPPSNNFRFSAPPAKFSGSTLFGHLNKAPSGDTSTTPENAEQGDAVEKETQGTGNKTWNQDTPVKFGGAAGTENASTTPAAPPPAFNSFFGSKTTASSSNTGLLNVPGAKPAMGFTFGGQAGSRASTPGVTTDGEGTNASTAGDNDTNEPSDDPPSNEAQVEDMTGLSAEETANETLLYSVKMSKASKWEEKKTDDGGTANGWVDKGRGPLYLLQNNDSGKVRILLKVPPYGAAKMNFPPRKVLGKPDYVVQGKAGKQITGSFWDHMADKPGMGRWLVQVGRKEDAEEVCRILREGAQD